MGIRDLHVMYNSLKHDEFFSEWNATNSFELESPVGLPNLSTDHSPNGNTASLWSTTLDSNSPKDSEIFSDDINYISRILMEDDIDEKLDMFQGHPALEATEKPYYDIIGEKYLPSPDQPPLNGNHSSESPDGSIHGNSNGGSSIIEVPSPQDYDVSVGYSNQSSFSSTNSSSIVDPHLSKIWVPDMFAESLPASQFERWVEVACKFFANEDKLVIDLESNGFSLPQEPKEGSRLIEVTVEEEREYGSRGRKNPHSDDLYLEEGRNRKQSASYYSEETLRSEMFDMVLLHHEDKYEQGAAALREAMENEASKNFKNGNPKGSGGGKARGRKQSKSEMVDLRTLLIHCAQAVSTNDRRSANELLNQIRQHSSPFGDGMQRLAHCFADGLEARLAGAGSQKYRCLVEKQVTATDNLKAYRFYMVACPFKQVSHFFSNQTILNVTEKASRIHIIDFGIYFGFQWPSFIQRLSTRPGGPPKLRITGIEIPQPGFRPAERIEETGRRIAEYARSFNVPFEYHAIAAKWETIQVDDIKIDKDEVLIVNCLYRFHNVVDETGEVEFPREKVLNTIRKLNPAIFIEAIVNGSYNGPFFVPRFREALFHFSSLFDSMETNVPREDGQRLQIERDIFGPQALNVIACEGSDRVERPETYKNWTVRNLRAGFVQLPLNLDIMKKARDKMKGYYHKEFIIDEDSRWLLLGWKGRALIALSTWRPNNVH